jgi:hypothetical protein
MRTASTRSISTSCYESELPICKYVAISIPIFLESHKAQETVGREVAPAST